MKIVRIEVHGDTGEERCRGREWPRGEKSSRVHDVLRLVMERAREDEQREVFVTDAEYLKLVERAGVVVMDEIKRVEDCRRICEWAWIGILKSLIFLVQYGLAQYGLEAASTCSYWGSRRLGSWIGEPGSVVSTAPDSRELLHYGRICTIP